MLFNASSGPPAIHDGTNPGQETSSF
jgi:hypothetical protein